METSPVAIAENLMLAASLPGGGNELIADFMGLHFHKADELKYNYSWDWLMPVIEKTESLWISGAQTRVTISGAFVQIVLGYNNTAYAKNSDLKKDNQIGGECYPNNYTKIENTYRMVLEFIKWYNQVCKPQRLD